MTQDQWGQPLNPGYVVRGEVVPNDEPGVPPAGQTPPMTRFEKVASRADQPDQPGPTASQDLDETPAEEDRAVSSPDAGNGDYWDADEEAPGDEPAEITAAGPAGDAAGAMSAPTADPGAGSAAPAGQAEEPAGQAEELAAQAEEPTGQAQEPAGQAQEPAGQAEEPAGQVEEPAAQAEEPAGQVEEPAAQAEEPAVQAEEPAGQADQPADEAGPNGHEATSPAMTQPIVSGALSRPPAATVPTVPIAVAQEQAGDGERRSDGERPAAAAGAQLRPGESGTTLGLGENGYASLIADTDDLWAQWHRIQYKFVDDPRASVRAAADVLAQVATRLEAAIAERERGLRGRWDASGTVDTETLRETLRMYRAFLDQLIGPEPS